MSYCFTAEYTIMELLNNSSFAPFNSTKDLSDVTWTGLIQVNFEDKVSLLMWRKPGIRPGFGVWGMDRDVRYCLGRFRGGGYREITIKADWVNDR